MSGRDAESNTSSDDSAIPVASSRLEGRLLDHCCIECLGRRILLSRGGEG